MRAAIAVAAMMTVGALACQPNEAAQGDEANAAPDTAADRVAHNQMRDAWIAAANRDDAPTVAGFYAEDAIFILPNGQVLNGRAAIQQALPDYFASAANLEVNEQSRGQSGDVIYVTGEFSEDMTTPDKKTVKSNGRYLVVSQRQSDGSWKIVRHAGVPVAPATPAN